MAFGKKNFVEVVLGATDKAGPGVKSFTQKLSGVVTGQKAIAAGAAAATAAIVYGFAKATAAASEYQAKMAEVRTLTNANTEDHKKLSNAVRDLSVRYGQLDDVMATASYNVVSAGFAGITEQVKILDIAARAAIAGVSDVNTAAKVITSTLNAYGKSADEAERISDILFTTVQGGVTTFSELSQYLGQVTATAAVAGIPFEEVASAIAVMTKKGIQSAEAVTALNGLILGIGAASGESKDLLDDLGISLEYGLGPALAALSKHADGSLEALKALIPNQRALKAAAAVGADGAKEFNDQLKKTEDSAYATSTAFEIMDDTARAAEDQFRAATKAMTTTLGEIGLDARKEIFESMTGAVGALANTISDHQDDLAILVNFLADVVTLVPDAVKGFDIMRQNIDHAFANMGGGQQPVSLPDRLRGQIANRPGSGGRRHEANLFSTYGANMFGVGGPMPEGAETIGNAAASAQAARNAQRAAIVNSDRYKMRQGSDDYYLSLIDIGESYRGQGGSPWRASSPGRDHSAAGAGPGNAQDDIEATLEAFEEMEASQERLTEMADEYDDTFKEVGATIADTSANALGGFAAAGVSAMFGLRDGAIDAGKAMTGILAMALETVIKKLLVIKLLGGLLGFKDGGTVPGLAFGGMIPAAAHGYAVPDGPRGMDSQLINAMPGEEVITRKLSQRLDRFLASSESAATISPDSLSRHGGGGINVTQVIGRPITYVDALDLARNAARANYETAKDTYR